MATKDGKVVRQAAMLLSELIELLVCADVFSEERLTASKQLCY